MTRRETLAVSLHAVYAPKARSECLRSAVGFFWQDKTSVFQEARVFNETPVSPRKCRVRLNTLLSHPEKLKAFTQILLTKIIYLLYVGETFGTQEATTLFFGVTKLFQHKDPALRQMVYLVIKELANVAEDVIMVTSSIMKDMQPNLEVIYRPNAIRTLCRIIDVWRCRPLDNAALML